MKLFAAGQIQLDHLDNTRHEYGIATDGFRWGVYAIRRVSA